MAEFILSAFSDEAGIDLDEQIRACQANGITHMELRGLPQGNVSSLTTDDAWVLKAKLDAEGMQVSAIGSPYGKMNIADDFEPHFAAFQNTVEVAKILGCHLIRMFSIFTLTKAKAMRLIGMRCSPAWAGWRIMRLRTTCFAAMKTQKGHLRRYRRALPRPLPTILRAGSQAYSTRQTSSNAAYIH